MGGEGLRRWALLIGFNNFKGWGIDLVRCYKFKVLYILFKFKVFGANPSQFQWKIMCL